MFSQLVPGGVDIAAQGTFGVVEIVGKAAFRALTLVQTGVVAAGLGNAAGEKFQLAAGGAGHDGHVQRAGHQVGQVAEQPAGPAQLQLVLADELHGCAAAETVKMGHGRLLSICCIWYSTI